MRNLTTKQRRKKINQIWASVHTQINALQMITHTHTHTLKVPVMFFLPNPLPFLIYEDW